tara:strand:- start:27373 stop:28686 length:1314 start_codon:yes stop_codon:yes gene_type:complete
MIKEVSKSQELLDRRSKIVANGVGVFNTATVSHAKGAIITDEDGRELIDFAGGIGVVNAGHCPPSVVKAIQEQAEKYLHTSFNVVSYEPYVELCEQIAEVLPHGENTKVMLVSTGAEAVENAVKIARQATGKQGVLCFNDAYHGRTMMAMTLTSKISYKVGCGPFSPEVYRIPFPNFYHLGQGKTEDEFVEEQLRYLHESANNTVDPNNLAAIILEPVQGEGGFNPVPKKYLQGLRDYCDKHNIMLIIDEVQSGFARAGNWACWQEYGVQPDISTYAKSLGSGLPIAAVVGKAKVMDAAAPGSIGGTYIGSPVCCAAALATIKLMKEQNLNERAKYIGNIIKERMAEVQKDCPAIGDIRGVGAMIGIEFIKNSDYRQADSELCSKVVKGCAEEGLIMLSAGMHKNVVRILSPIVISDEELHKGLDILIHQIKKHSIS